MAVVVQRCDPRTPYSSCKASYQHQLVWRYYACQAPSPAMAKSVCPTECTLCIRSNLDLFMQMPGTLAGSERSFPALDDALQQIQLRPSADSHNTQDEDSLLRSQWSIQAVPDLASKKQDFQLLRKWLRVSLCLPSKCGAQATCGLAFTNSQSRIKSKVKCL